LRRLSWLSSIRSRTGRRSACRNGGVWWDVVWFDLIRGNGESGVGSSGGVGDGGVCGGGGGGWRENEEQGEVEASGESVEGG